jgi:hypothetical protein
LRFNRRRFEQGIPERPLGIRFQRYFGVGHEDEPDRRIMMVQAKLMRAVQFIEINPNPSSDINFQKVLKQGVS